MKIQLKTWHKIAIAIVTPTILVGAYYGGKYAIKKYKEFKNKNTENKEEPVANHEAKRHDEFPLKKGSYGGRVLTLQAKINKIFPPMGASKIKEDGKWGNNTEDAIITAFGDVSPISEQKYYELLNK